MVEVVEVVLHKLHAGREVCMVELVGAIPVEGAKLTPLLHAGVQEGHCAEDGPPLCMVAVVHSQLCLLLAERANRPLMYGNRIVEMTTAERDSGHYVYRDLFFSLEGDEI